MEIEDGRDRDSGVPRTRSQRYSIVALPAFLALAAAKAWEAWNGPLSEGPVFMVFVLGIPASMAGIAILAGMAWSQRGEQIDEREGLIILRSAVNAYVLLGGGIFALSFTARLMPDIDVVGIVTALFFLSLATSAATILFYGPVKK